MKMYYQMQHPPPWSKLSYATNGFCTENSTIVDYEVSSIKDRTVVIKTLC